MMIVLVVFGAFMEGFIIRNVDSSLVVLLQKRGMSKERRKPKSLCTCRSHTTSAVVSAMALYSDSMEYQETTCCFFEHRTTRESLKKYAVAKGGGQDHCFNSSNNIDKSLSCM